MLLHSSGFKLLTSYLRNRNKSSRNATQYYTHQISPLFSQSAVSHFSTTNCIFHKLSSLSFPAISLPTRETDVNFSTIRRGMELWKWPGLIGPLIDCNTSADLVHLIRNVFSICTTVQGFCVRSFVRHSFCHCYFVWFIGFSVLELSIHTCDCSSRNCKILVYFKLARVVPFRSY